MRILRIQLIECELIMTINRFAKFAKLALKKQWVNSYIIAIL